MNRRRRLGSGLLALLVLAVLAPLPLGYAGPFDSIKKKAEKKAQEAAKQPK